MAAEEMKPKLASQKKLTFFLKPQNSSTHSNEIDASENGRPSM
jgi:hypothetical protein